MPNKSTIQHSKFYLTQTLRWLDPIYPGRRLGLAAAGILLLVGWLGLPATGILMFIGLVLLVYFAVWLYNALHFVDAQIGATVGEPSGWPVHRKVYPLYKFVDIRHAAQLFAGQQPGSVELRSAHQFVLGT